MLSASTCPQKSKTRKQKHNNNNNMMQSPKELSLPLVAKEANNESSSKSNCTTYIEIILSLALPVLLHVQFSIVCSEESQPGLDQATVDSAIVVFFLASVLYRLVLSEEQRDVPMIFHLLPECFGVVAITLVSSAPILMGFLCLSLGTITLSVAVASNCAISLLSESSRVSLFGLSVTIGLPALVYAQYYITFASQTDTQGLSFSMAQCEVLSFLLVSLMYRKVIESEKFESTAAHLIPELVAVSTILFTIHGDIAVGFYCLGLGDIALACTVVWYCLPFRRQRQSDRPESEPLLAQPTEV